MRSDTANLLDDMTSSIKKHAGELKALGRSKSDKMSVEEAEAMLKDNPEAFDAFGLRKERKRSSSMGDLVAEEEEGEAPTTDTQYT